MNPFTDIRALIIDMDGVLWHGNQAVPGLTDFFQILRDKNLPFILATNNASHTPQQYVSKLAEMGVVIEPKEIMTSALATAMYLTENMDPAQTRVFVVGEDGAIQALQEQGFTLTGLYEINGPTSKGADVVVCGKDHTLTWDKLATATLNIRAGAQFIGTNDDNTLPTELGLIHGNGAILAALQTATGVSPTIIGKPEPIMYQQAISRLGADLSETIAIGDKLETDILGAIRTGIRSLMVLGGVSTEADLKASEYQPTWVMQDLRAVTEALGTLKSGNF
ncbi:protein NagD [Methyloglobulus morosus KoM1]|uniref:Protein NagD n=1 Tax=Methyloglobulus morosus KoM1 TaxID=1116472 RepID=V5DZB9_9GAMM|nr:HAD-IIA family hydrolase [Methyloglobulus morosus]ESS72641.1 protein NagD [Methyloglobulus morosus KoM1]